MLKIHLKETEVLNDWFVRLVEKVRMKVVEWPRIQFMLMSPNEGVTGTVTLAQSFSAALLGAN